MKVRSWSTSFDLFGEEKEKERFLGGLTCRVVTRRVHTRIQNKERERKIRTNKKNKNKQKEMKNFLTELHLPPAGFFQGERELRILGRMPDVPLERERERERGREFRRKKKASPMGRDVVLTEGARSPVRPHCHVDQT